MRVSVLLVVASSAVIAGCLFDPPASARHHRPGHAHPTPLPTAAGPVADAEILGGSRIVTHDAIGGRAHVALVANEHEGLAELAVSPDKRWATAMVSYPYDVIGAQDIQHYRIIVHLRTSARLDLQDFPKHFGLASCVVQDFEWQKGKTATLTVHCADGTTPAVDMPDAGVPPIPDEDD